MIVIGIIGLRFILNYLAKSEILREVFPSVFRIHRKLAVIRLLDVDL